MRCGSGGSGVGNLGAVRRGGGLEGDEMRDPMLNVE
jgi:hypothetical protein